MMTILFILCFCTVFILALIGSLKLRTWDSGVHMTSVNSLDDAEKFHLLARWGA
ncbi:MAG TPA: hypothetical protein VJ974_04660 [Geopsychrobacteraceae bacterium]|nr:hypothetical protein [Geopsychrobacteraceae bacterium]